MSAPDLEILVTAGPLKDRRFAIPPAGLRLGRSSTCEIAIKDPALSRNHCLIEVRGGIAYVTDLASANGTYVNDAALGGEAVPIKAGDVVSVGDSAFTLASAASAPAPAPAAPKVDLGLGKASRRVAAPAPEEEEAPGESRLNLSRIGPWVAAGLAIAGAAYLILSDTAGEETAKEEKAPPVTPLVAPERPAEAEEPAASGKLVALSFEKVVATAENVYRMEIALSCDGVLSAAIDDVPAANRHVAKEVKLAEDKRARLEEIFRDEEFYHAPMPAPGTPLKPGELKSVRLRVVRSARVFDFLVENEQEPAAFGDVREKLEAFAKNELGVWGIDKSADELRALSAAARRAGEAKWEERDVKHGNVAEAIRSFDEAVMLLGTVNPKPADYDALTARLKEARDELTRRYKDQCFRADRAINLKDWPAALQELRVLCDMVPDRRDSRHAEAHAKLLDVEARQRKGER